MDTDSQSKTSAALRQSGSGFAEMPEDPRPDGTLQDDDPPANRNLAVEDPASERHANAQRYPVVVIGASAGELQAFQQLLENLGPATGFSFVLVPHLASDQKSFLAEILQRYPQTPRVHIADGRPPAPNHLYQRDSRNQELVFAQDEIQSANQALRTLNDELQRRNSLLAQTGNDLSNLLNSVNIPLLMLGNDLHIRQFTAPMQHLLNLRPADIGRSISEIRLQLSVENIVPILNQVLETLGARELEVQDRDGRWHLLRVRPYRTAENKIEGLVLVLVDIDQLRRSQQDLVYARDFARSVLESVPVPIVVLNQNFAIRTVNTAFRDLTQMSATDLENRSLPELLDHLWAIDGLCERLDTLLSAPVGTITEFQHQSDAPRQKCLLIKAQVLAHDGDRVLLLMLEDITLRHQAELRVSRQREALESEVESATMMLNRTQEELRSLTAHLFRVQEEERQRVARELHDDVCQRLSLLEMALEQMRNENAAAEPPPRLRTAIELAQALNSDVRRLSHCLHPAIIKDLGLSAALKALVKDFGELEQMPVTYLTRNLPESWSIESAIAIYRIAQEALRNVSRHAGKTHVKVMLSGVKGRLQLRVMDFGVGFDQDEETPAGGLGMISMQERARLAGGFLTIKSSLGQGTTVTAEVPLEGHA